MVVIKDNKYIVIHAGRLFKTLFWGAENQKI